jgi:hypothetical protein
MAASAVASIVAAPAGAAVLLQSSDNIFCHGESCFGIDRGVGSRGVGSNSSVTIGGVTFDRAQLGALGSSLVHVTLWDSAGDKMVGDFGNYQLSVLGGDQLTLRGPSVTFDASAGGVMFRFDQVDPSGGGAGGGGFGGGFGGGGLNGGGGGMGVDSHIASTNGVDLIAGVSSNAVDLNDPQRDPPPIPEPAAWGLMLVGFAGLGGVLRFRRAAQNV